MPAATDAALGAVTLRGISKDFESGRGVYSAVRGIDLDVNEGSFVSLVGPSGCGKSTILNMVAGLLPATGGSIRVFGEPLTGINRRATYMFQQDALLPWKTVLQNVCLGLRFRGRSDAESRALGLDWIRRVGLDGFAERFPHQLSGGMRKRCAMAQCWVVDPDIVLMDEPFAALDVHSRQRMGSEVLDLWASSRKTVLFITHDLEEAIAMADEVVVLSAGPASRIIGRHAVNLPRPRCLIDIKTEPAFTEMYRVIWSDLRAEVLKSYERAAG